MSSDQTVERRFFPSGILSRYRKIWRSRKVRAFAENRLNLVGLALVTFLVFCAVFGPYLTPYSPVEAHLTNRLQPPSLAHPMGTDQLGRDILTRVLYGARISLGIAVSVVAITLVIGTTVGVIAGYAGGWIDEALMRFVDILIAFPGILLALVIAGVLGPSLVNVMIALALVGWTGYTRVVRGSVLSVRKQEYVKAAQLMDVSRPRLVIRHIVPNVISPVVVLATMNMAYVILGIAGLSFLGLGAQPPTPEWGTMLAAGRKYIGVAWWVVTFPGLAIMLTVFGFNLLGDGLRDVLDPRDVDDVSQKGL